MKTHADTTSARRGSDPSAIEVAGGRRAIEVVTLFEDTIVDARHFDDPRAGMLRRSTIAAVAGGALALVLSLVLFLVAYAQVVRDRAAALSGAHVAIGGGVVLDLLAVFFVVAGVAAIGWGLLRRQEEHKPRDFTVGPDASALVHVGGADLPAPCFPLLRSTGDDFELLVSAAMKGDITVDNGKVYALVDLVHEGKARPVWTMPGAFALPIPDGARVRVEIGEVSILLRPCAPPSRQPVPLRFDGRALRFTAGTAAFAAVALAMMFAIPADPKSLALERLDEVRRIQFLVHAIETPPPAIDPALLQKKPLDDAGSAGQAARGPGGKMGNEKSKNHAPRKYQMKGNARDERLAQELIKDSVQTSGALGIINAKGSPFASIFSHDDSALGKDANDVLAGLVGTQGEDSWGVPGGLGLVGSGRGGLGTGEGTIGIGTRLGLIGDGGPGGPGRYGRRLPKLDSTHRIASAPTVTMSVCKTFGMDKEIIRRVVRQHINEIKFCYEQGLQRNPELYGRVVVQFHIGGNGLVAASLVQSSTMNNPPVEQCAVQAVRRWSFPRPEQGGTAIVSYPFVFNRSGQSESSQ